MVGEINLYKVLIALTGGVAMVKEQMSESEQVMVRDEVKHIILDSLKRVFEHGDGVYCLPNGSLWTHQQVVNYIEDNLK